MENILDLNNCNKRAPRKGAFLLDVYSMCKHYVNIVYTLCYIAKCQCVRVAQ